MFKRKKMKELVDLAKLSDKAEVQLKTVCESIERVIKDCTMRVMNCEDRNWNLISFWLISPEQGKPDLRPFRTYFKDSTIDVYTSYWQQFFCFCLRILGEKSTYGAEFKPGQRKKLEKLRDMVKLRDLTVEELNIMMRELSMQMIMHSD